MNHANSATFSAQQDSPDHFPFLSHPQQRVIQSIYDRLTSIDDRLGAIESRTASIERRLSNIESIADQTRRDVTTIMEILQRSNKPADTAE
jgi:archaellum component FlaC